MGKVGDFPVRGIPYYYSGEIPKGAPGNSESKYNLK